MNVTLVTATLSVAVVLSVVTVPRFRVVLVPCTAVGAATVGLTVSAGAVTVTVTMRLSTAAPPLAGVTVSVNVRVEFGAPTASVGALNFAVGVLAFTSVTCVPATCDQRYVTVPV